jgi:hypothetical protein
MKRNDDTIAILFVSILTIIIWVWAAGKTKHTDDVLVTVYLLPPVGSTSTISPEETELTLTLSGSRTAVDAAKAACADKLHLTLSESDEKLTLSDISTRIATLDAIKDTGAIIDEAKSSAFPLAIHTVELVEAAVEIDLPNITVSGDVEVYPATVLLHIPKELRKTLPKAITARAVVSSIVLQQLQPGIQYEKIDAVIRLSKELEDEGITATPSRVSVDFKIQSSTKTKELAQVRILIAGPAEDYAAYAVTLPIKIIPNVTIEADAEIIAGIESGNVKVFAVLRLASSDMEQRIPTKRVTTFLAIMEDGTGHELVATVQNPSLLDIELVIEPVSQPVAP